MKTQSSISSHRLHQALRAGLKAVGPLLSHLASTSLKSRLIFPSCHLLDTQRGKTVHYFQPCLEKPHQLCMGEKAARHPAGGSSSGLRQPGFLSWCCHLSYKTCVIMGCRLSLTAPILISKRRIMVDLLHWGAVRIK